jgi:hypothetical protein
MAAATARIARLVLDVVEENAAEFLSWTSRLDMDTEPVDVERLYPMKREADGTWTQRYLGPDPAPEARGPRHGEERRYRITSRPQQRQDATYPLGGHLKTGQSWTGQNRPVGELPQARVFYRVRS